MAEKTVEQNQIIRRRGVVQGRLGGRGRLRSERPTRAERVRVGVRRSRR